MVTRGISISPRWAKNFTLMNALEDSDAVSAASQAEGLFGDVESLAYEPSELEGGPEGFAAGAELLEESSKRRRFKTAAEGAKDKDWHLDQFPQDGNSQALCIHLARAQLQAMPKLPWETSPVFGPWGSQFTQPFRYPVVGRFEAMNGIAAASSSFRQTHASRPEYILRRLRLAGLRKTEDSARRGALLKLRSLILLDPITTNLGASLVSAAGTLVDESLVAQSFADAFAPKSTNTLTKRVSALWRYGKWCEAKQVSPFNITENAIYQYLCSLRSEGSSPSAPSSFLEGLGFLHGVAGIKSLGDRLSFSGRCKGLARDELRKRRKRRQASPLSVSMVRTLEKFVQQDRSHKALIAGHILFAVFSCARWSDTLQLVEITQSFQGRIVLIETATEHHKLSTTDEARTMLLPYICLGQCLDKDGEWSTHWLYLRAAHKVGRPFMPVAMPSWDDKSHCFTSVPMSSSEATMWVREILETNGFSREEMSKITSHAFKATLLSWAAKSNMFSRSQRRQMGHHLDPEDRSMLLYSRDSYAGLAVGIRRMRDRIVSGKFNPDLSRVARVAQEVEQLDEASNASSSSSSSSSSEESDPPSPSTALRRTQLSAPPEGIAADDVEICMVHTLSGVVHLSASDAVFKCGRLITSNYVSWGSCKFEQGDTTACSQCCH